MPSVSLTAASVLSGADCAQLFVSNGRNHGAANIPSTQKPPTSRMIAVATRFARCAASFLSLFCRYSTNVGTNAAEAAELLEAARVDGATENGVARHVTVPLAASALSAGLVMAWARALGEFGATIMFAGNIAGRTQTLPLLVYSEFQGSLDAALVAAAILVMAAFGVLVAVRLRRLGDRDTPS